RNPRSLSTETPGHYRQKHQVTIARNPRSLSPETPGHYRQKPQVTIARNPRSLSPETPGHYRQKPRIPSKSCLRETLCPGEPSSSDTQWTHLPTTPSP
ncbi:hypothetical protein AAFF_G00336790, partial [Aldrovandia affinis]